MLERRDWITPTLYGQPWLEKPVLYYWQAILSYKIFGVSDWAARLPAAVDATLMIVAVYLFCRRFWPGLQLDGALITAATAGVIGFSRGAGTDMPLAAMFVIAMLAWAAWYYNRRRTLLVMFYFFLALATLAKGPVAIILAVLIILIFCLLRHHVPLLRKTLWLPGIVLFLAVLLPWYLAIQVRNPQFFRVFVLEHNLSRFTTNLYQHRQPFWYFLPVLALTLMPWTVLVIAALAQTLRNCHLLREQSAAENPFPDFLLIWVAVVLIFFSVSQSKLPGYILPAVPACALLVVDYLQRGSSQELRPHVAWLLLHSALAAGLLGPALLVRYLLLRQPAPRQAIVIAVIVPAGFFAGIFLTLWKRGLRTLRFVTLVPVIFTLATLVRIGGPVLDEAQSARPVARELAAMETTPLRVAVFGASRETEYGLAFYRNQVIARYERGEVPAGEHLLVAVSGSKPALTRLLNGRRVSRLGSLQAQHLDYYWVSPAP